ncbi:hypothetical protein [Botrimarina sp.]|uniref:hypothetical protein n=1 Tax=Botrimarina sp. TaxID=2795802 RepID=UPI0032F01F98
MNTTATFIPETDLTPDEIRAGERDGVLVAWRVDETGKQWFRHTPVIHGVPAADSQLEAAVDA